MVTKRDKIALAIVGLIGLVSVVWMAHDAGLLWPIVGVVIALGIGAAKLLLCGAILTALVYFLVGLVRWAWEAHNPRKA